MKDWAEDLPAHVAEWSQKLEKSGRGWWPRYIYHHTDIRNGISILNEGILYSRERSSELGLMRSDNADPAVLGQTEADHLKFVRLYFRPRTPTLYNTEGIRHPDWRSHGHCPMPIYFVFDFVGVLQRDETRFSKGTIASNMYGHSDKRDYFRKIEFADVYHDSGLGYANTPRKREIIQRRQAEVLVPRELALQPDLRAVCCRTPAERITLIHGLNSAVRKRWSSRIRVGGDKMFFRSHPHVKSVLGVGNELVVELYAAHHQDIPYTLRVIGGGRHGTVNGVIKAKTLSQRFRLQGDWGNPIVTLQLHDCIAFEGPVILSDLPF